MTNFTFYFSRAICFLMLSICLFIPGQTKAQKKAVAYLSNPVVYINLMLPSADTLLLVDGTGALYANKFSAGVDDDDAGKLSNINENICLLRNGKQLAIETRPIPRQSDTLFIHMWGLLRQTYDLQITLKSIPLMLPVNAWLVDNYLHTQIQVNLFGKTLYSFSPGTDTAGYLNRFMIFFDKSFKQESNLVNTDNRGAELNTSNILAYPNPVTGSRLSLVFTNMPKDNYIIKLISSSGETLSGINIMHAGGNNKYYLPLNSVYIRGVYAVTIFGINTHKTIHLPVVISQ